MTVIRQHYEEQLKDLIKDLRALGIKVYFSIEKAVQSLNKEDRNFARQIIKGDLDINQLEDEINEKVVMLITKQQPIATDLRMMIAALKIASEFERIGDNAASIAKIRKRVKITDHYILTRLKTMGDLGLLMLKDLDTAFKNKDVTLILEIIERDKD
ncbi:phosphate transport system regulatory protein PhoU, partial [Staphylococcus simulans]